MILIQEKSESAENLESTEKMTLRLGLFIRSLHSRPNSDLSLNLEWNLTIRTNQISSEDFSDDLNLRKIGIRGKSGIHGKMTLRLGLLIRFLLFVRDQI